MSADIYGRGVETVLECRYTARHGAISGGRDLCRSDIPRISLAGQISFLLSSLLFLFFFLFFSFFPQYFYPVLDASDALTHAHAREKRPWRMKGCGPCAACSDSPFPLGRIRTSLSASGVWFNSSLVPVLCESRPERIYDAQCPAAATPKDTNPIGVRTERRGGAPLHSSDGTEMDSFSSTTEQELLLLSCYFLALFDCYLSGVSGLLFLFFSFFPFALMVFLSFSFSFWGNQTLLPSKKRKERKRKGKERKKGKRKKPQLNTRQEKGISRLHFYPSNQSSPTPTHSHLFCSRSAHRKSGRFISFPSALPSSPPRPRLYGGRAAVDIPTQTHSAFQTDDRYWSLTRPFIHPTQPLPQTKDLKC